MVDAYIQSLENKQLLNDKELLYTVINRLPEGVKPLLVHSEGSNTPYYDDLSSASVEHLLQDTHLCPDTHSLLLSCDQGPVSFTQAQFAASTQFTPAGESWVVPLAVAEESKWLILMDEQGTLVAASVERLYYHQGWLFSRRDLEVSRRELKKANSWIDHELEEMTRLQQLMLPDEGLSIPGVKVAYTYRAMKGAGGDYLDVIDLSKDREQGAHDVGVIVADVTGHGPVAAVEAAMLDAILRTFKPSDDSEGPSEVLNYINQHFFTRKERGSFLTANIFRYLALEKTLTYANAGHPHAYVKRGKKLIPLTEGGIPIGVIRENKWHSQQVPIEPGDILFIYTDVVIETKDRFGEDFGFERLEEALIESQNYPEVVIKTVEKRMKDFCNCKVFQDDLTMCAVQFGL